MDKTPLYQQIAESVRQEILYGDLRPGDRLPSIRDMAARWDCTLGTAQRAYQELAQQGIVTKTLTLNLSTVTQKSGRPIPPSPAPWQRARPTWGWA
jgi:DNA-binding transcriptional regulator YhcF (GntR family)